jgi:hypothetical protein
LRVGPYAYLTMCFSLAHACRLLPSALADAGDQSASLKRRTVREHS